MIKNISLARHEYAEAYRHIRLFGGAFFHENRLKNWTDAEDCALLSYDYFDSHFSGWINRQRQHKFHMIKWHPELRNELPF